MAPLPIPRREAEPFSNAPANHTDIPAHYEPPSLGQLLWPLGLLIGGLIAIIAVLLLFAAREQNDLAARASVHLARGVFAAEADSVKNHTRDYATWTEAVDNLLLSYDAEWIEENIGSWAYDGINMDATIVVDSAGRVIYGMVAGEEVGAAAAEHVTEGLQALIAATAEAARAPGATEPTGLARSAYVLLDDAVAIASAAPIVQTNGRLPGGPGSETGILVYVRALDPDLLQAMGERYLLTGLRLVAADARPDGASFPLATASGTVLAKVAWQPEQPGFATVRPLLAPGVVTVLMVTFLLWVVLRHAQRTMRHLEELTVSLAGARDRAEQQRRVEAELRAKAVDASRAKSEFLALMSHELRTPLNAILGFSETIATQVFGPAASERYRDYARDIHESGSHLLSIINDILDLSKIEAGRYELHEEDVDLDEVLVRCAALLRERVHQAQLTLTCPTSAIRLRADPRALKQILFNLLSNAIKFTDAGGSIEVTVSAGADGVAIAVADSGIGMSDTELARAVQPFGQAASSFTRSVGGTGLGLNVTQSLVALHGGRLDLRSAPGEGTVAIVRLPAQRVRARAPALRLGPVEA